MIVALNTFAGLTNGWLIAYREWHWFEVVNAFVFVLSAVATAYVLSYMKRGVGGF